MRLLVRVRVLVLVLVLVLALALGACGRVGFGDRVDATLLDGAVDSFDASTVACDPYELTGCQADAACYLGGAGATVCSSPPGTLAAATACTATTTCTPGDACVRLDTGTGDCTAICRTSADCTFGSCLDVHLAQYGACERNCDPVADQGCISAGDHCYLVSSAVFPEQTSTFGTFCNSPHGLAQGGACTAQLDCGPQLACVNTVCQPICDALAPNCPTGTCHAFLPNFTRAGHKVGACF